MSIALPDVDLSTAVVGTSGVIDLSSLGITSDPSLYKRPPTLYFFNDSGDGLSLAFQVSQDTLNLPAGAWLPVALQPGENQVTWTVKYVLPNPPVSKLMVTYYAPSEPVPSIVTLGNSPIGGGTVATNQTLSNEANNAGTEVIDIGVPGNQKLIDIFNDHFLWQILQSGVVHQVLKGQTSGNPLQLGQAGDITEILGKLQLDGQVISPSGSPITFNASSGQQIQFLQNGTTIFFMDNTGIHLFGNFAYDLGSTGLFKFRNGNTTQAWGNFSGTGSGTYNHGFGSAPFAVIPIVDVVGSATQGYDTITSTQVHITLGAPLDFRATMWS